MTMEPTSVGPQNTPACCWMCGRHAVGLGLGRDKKSDHPNDIRWLCVLCAPLAAQIKSALRLDVYEENALTATIDYVGPLVERNGNDLSAWSEEQVREFVAEIVLGFGSSIREQVRLQEVPF